MALRTPQLHISGLSWDIDITKTTLESSSKIITKLFQSFFSSDQNWGHHRSKGQFRKMMFSTITSLISKIDQRFWQHSLCLVKASRNIYVTLKGQDQIWPQVKVGQGHEVTQVGHIIYHSTCLYETNALTSIPRLYLLLIASYWQKSWWPRVTSFDL